MEVAGHWRREWAGTAEYGKVTEGGVTRRMARAMEVMHASGPGARVRVVRAAYHQTAGRGAPAASYLMHSSRTVLSSGFSLLESPTYPSLPSKPLEISSSPLESSPEPATDTENYKVTEPDDFEISEPSKWKSSSNRNSARLPSEESSSTDNASIIELDSKIHLRRKYSYDSENSDTPTYRRNSSRLSPLLDAPAALSTLKYKSLLNGSSDWNSRRKSYSFEDTSPLNETILHSNDTLAMDSSTDSGICKSTEIVNDTEDKYFERKDGKYERHENTFKDWLSKNRSTPSFYKGLANPYREHGVVIEEPGETTIALQSKGKVTITVPITVADDYEYKKTQTNDDADRKVKKVEFCKTELHFATDTGKVNIIATDEKPPPSNDFRKRRSAFVPIHENFEKPITLFGESNKEFPMIGGTDFTNNTNENTEFDENTAATKSILKNKIPKPKPYLLGENMAFGSTEEKSRDSIYDSPVPVGVSLINRQLHEERRGSAEVVPNFSIDRNSSFMSKASRTTSTSPQPSDSLKTKRKVFETASERSSKTQETNFVNSVKSKLNTIQLSPVPVRAKTRQLRDSELTYFGIDQDRKYPDNINKKDEIKTRSASNSIDDLFHSVSLIRKVSNSVCNSEAESEDTPEYQNIPLKTNFAPIPTPRQRSIYDTEHKEIKKIKPVAEEDDESNIYCLRESRRSRTKRQEESSLSRRTVSEPPKPRENTQRRGEQSRCDRKKVLSVKKHPNIDITEENEPMYVNSGFKGTVQRNGSVKRNAERSTAKTNSPSTFEEIKTGSVRSGTRNLEKESKDSLNKTDRTKRTQLETSNIERKPSRKIRTEKLATPEYSNEKHTIERVYDKASSQRKSSSQVNSTPIEESQKRDKHHGHLSPSPQLNSSKKSDETPTRQGKKSHEEKETKLKDLNVNDAVKYRTRTSSKDRSSTRDSSNIRKHQEHANDSYRNATKSSKNREINNSERVHGSKADPKASRSEYVINYDDKNGTVSSVCVMKSGSSSSKKKTKDKDSPREYKIKNKLAEKVALLQCPDHEVYPYESNYEYADRKWKRKMHVHRTCQLL